MEDGFGIWGRRKVMAVARAEARVAMAVARVSVSIAMARAGVSFMSLPTGSLRSGGSAIHRESVLLSSE